MRLSSVVYLSGPLLSSAWSPLLSACLQPAVANTWPNEGNKRSTACGSVSQPQQVCYLSIILYLLLIRKCTRALQISRNSGSSKSNSSSSSTNGNTNTNTSISTTTITSTSISTNCSSKPRHNMHRGIEFFLPLLLRGDPPEFLSGGKTFLRWDPTGYLQSLLQIGRGIQVKSNIGTGS